MPKAVQQKNYRPSLADFLGDNLPTGLIMHRHKSNKDCGRWRIEIAPPEGLVSNLIHKARCRQHLIALVHNYVYEIDIVDPDYFDTLAKLARRFEEGPIQRLLAEYKERGIKFINFGNDCFVTLTILDNRKTKKKR